MTAEHVPRPSARRAGSRLPWILVAVAVLAFSTRAELILAHAGLFGLHFYDDGVYYAGAAALLAGRSPYRDFVFLHPPGILLALSPFAALGAVTSDPVGLATARVAFWALGALNAALVARVAARHGRLPAAVGGLCYAVSYPAMYAERTALLEPLGNTALLVALLLLGGRTAQPTPRSRYLAGAALGLGACVKIWMGLPLAVVVLWQLLERGRRDALRVVAGAVAAAAVVLLPFAGSGRAMFRMVVLDQLGRTSERPFLHRATGIAGLRPWQPYLGAGATWILLLAVTALVLVAATAAWRAGGDARWYVVLLVATVAFLLWAPPFFEHYPTFTAVPLCLVVAAALGRVPRVTAGEGWRLRPRAVVALGVCLVLLLMWAPTLRLRLGVPFPGRELASAVADRPCVVSDDPTALIEMDVLTRDLRRGCPPVVDVSGISFDRYLVMGRDGEPLPRAQNPRWQRRVAALLQSGSAMVVVDVRLTGLAPATLRRLAKVPVLATAGPYAVRGRPLPAAVAGAAGR